MDHPALPLYDRHGIREGASMVPLVAVVDDDVSVRESLESLIRSAGLEVRLSASAEEFLTSPHFCKADCLVLDVRLPGMSGIELHRHLVAQRCEVPVIFMTAHESDNRARSEAASEWTVAYLTKPFSDDDFLGAVAAALQRGPSS
jgi:FixJ family two-component response regulator